MRPIHVPRTVLAASLALAPSLVLGSCTEGGIIDPEDVADGGFEVTLSGSVSRTAQGNAIFGTPGAQLMISLTETPPRVLINLVRTAGGRVAPGTYTIAPQGNFFAWGTVSGVGSFVAAEGTLTITASSSERLEGRFSFEAVNSQGQALFSARGAFRARCGHSPRNCD